MADKPSWRKTLNDWFNFVGTTAGVLCFLGVPTVGAFFPDSWNSAREWVQSVLLALAGSAICVAAITTSVRHIRRARYAEAIVAVQHGSSILHKEQFAPNRTAVDRQAAATAAVEQLTAAFAVLTGRVCRTCVQVVERSADRKAVGVRVFCRSGGDAVKPEVQPIAHNTDFQQLTQNPNQKWFFGNDLPRSAQRGEYCNTTPDFTKKYQASVVWPIRELYATTPDGPALLGFLCVDSRGKNVFSEEFDYPVGAALADAFSLFLTRMLDDAADTDPVAKDVASSESRIDGGLHTVVTQESVEVTPDGGKVMAAKVKAELPAVHFGKTKRSNRTGSQGGGTTRDDAK